MTFKDILADPEGKKLIEAIEHGSSDTAIINDLKDQLKSKFGYQYDETVSSKDTAKKDKFFEDQKGTKSTSTHIGDMTFTEKKVAAKQLGIDPTGKTVGQLNKELADKNVDKALQEWKDKRKSTSTGVDDYMSGAKDLKLVSDILSLKKGARIILSNPQRGNGRDKDSITSTAYIYENNGDGKGVSIMIPFRNSGMHTYISKDKISSRIASIEDRRSRTSFENQYRVKHQPYGPDSFDYEDEQLGMTEKEKPKVKLSPMGMTKEQHQEVIDEEDQRQHLHDSGAKTISDKAYSASVERSYKHRNHRDKL
jgi:hypothetical protein